VDPYSLAQPDGNRSFQGPKSQRRNARYRQGKILVRGVWDKGAKLQGVAFFKNDGESSCTSKFPGQMRGCTQRHKDRTCSRGIAECVASE
jgi:hypothetical protein